MGNDRMELPVKFSMFTGILGAILIGVLTHGPAVATIKSSERTVLLNHSAEPKSNGDGRTPVFGDDVEQCLVQEIRFVDAWGRSWIETEHLTREPVSGGMKTIEVKLFERALAGMQPIAQSNSPRVASESTVSKD